MEITEIRVKVICRTDARTICSDLRCERCSGTGYYETWASPSDIFRSIEDEVRWAADDRIKKNARDEY